MPTYEYACTQGHRFDVVQSFSDEPLTACTECGEPVKRVFHPVGIVLKGSGFYATDNRSGKSLATGKDDKGSTPAKTETKKADAPKKSETKSSDTKGS